MSDIQSIESSQVGHRRGQRPGQVVVVENQVYDPTDAVRLDAVPAIERLISKLPYEAVEAVRRVLRGESLVNPQEAFTCVRSLPHDHVAAVLGTLEQLGLHTLLAGQPSRWRDLAVALIAARVIDPQSKLATARALAPESAVSTLGEMLRVGAVDQHELYAAMDWLVERQATLEQRLAKRHLEDHTLVLYDLTSSYLEGSHCPLARRGHSRDGKKGTLQIVFGLLCTSTGCPLAVAVFEGSTSDPNTVASAVLALRLRAGGGAGAAAASPAWFGRSSQRNACASSTSTR